MASARFMSIKMVLLQRKHHLMNAYTETHFISKAKHMPFVNKDGVTIDGWVLEPKDYDPSKS
mgnify:CR=1 FL=1